MNWTAAGTSGIPFARVAIAGTLLIGAIGLTVSRASSTPIQHAGAYRLVLHVDEESRDYTVNYYGSQWEAGPVILDHDASDGKRVEFTRQWPFVDGCTWESTEVLEPIAPLQYRYSYTDRAVSCPEDANEGIPTPRTGTVDVVPIIK